MIGNKRTLLIAGALALVMPLGAWAAGGMGGGMGGGPSGSMDRMSGHYGMHDCNRHKRMQRMERMERSLGLTDAQKKQVKALHEEAWKEMKPLYRQKHEYMRQMWKLNPDDKGYMSEVKNLAEKQGDLTEKMVIAKAQLRAKFFSILTDAQKAKLKKMHEMRHHHRRGMGGAMHGGY